MPSIAYRAMVDAAITPVSVTGVTGGCATKVAGVVSRIQPPSIAMASMGSSFSTVVTICTPPPVRTPNRLTATNDHSRPSANSAGWILPSSGITTVM